MLTEPLTSNEIFFFFFLFRAIPTTDGSSQARGWMGSTAASLHPSHSNARSLTHWARPGIKPQSSWILVGFVTAGPQGELLLMKYLSWLTLPLSQQVLPEDRLLFISKIIFKSKFSDLEASMPVACVVPRWVYNTKLMPYPLNRLYRFKEERRAESKLLWPGLPYLHENLTLLVSN